MELTPMKFKIKINDMKFAHFVFCVMNVELRL